MTFNSIDALKNYILSKSEVAVRVAQEKVFLLINNFIKQYYSEYSPSIYERTYQLFRSLVKTDVVSTGKGWVAEVYFDASNLDYQVKKLTSVPVDGGYKNPFNGAISSNGSFPNPNGSGEKTLAAAAHGSHGGKVGGTAIWDDPMIILNKEAVSMLKQSLIQAGIPVK